MSMAEDFPNQTFLLLVAVLSGETSPLCGKGVFPQCTKSSEDRGLASSVGLKQDGIMWQNTGHCASLVSVLTIPSK